MPASLPVSSYDEGLHVLNGVVTFGASSAVSSQESYGFTVSSAGTGLFTVTLDETWKELVGFSVDLMQATPTDLLARVTAQDMSAKTVSVTTWDISAAAAAHPTSGNLLYVTLLLRNAAAPGARHK